LGDLAVGEAVDGKPCDAQLARGQRLDAGEHCAACACAGRGELGAGVLETGVRAGEEGGGVA
jgi:hypothetical protein